MPPSNLGAFLYPISHNGTALIRRTLRAKLVDSHQLAFFIGKRNRTKSVSSYTPWRYLLNLRKQPQVSDCPMLRPCRLHFYFPLRQLSALPNRWGIFLTAEKMKRDWKIIRKILENIESETLSEYVHDATFGQELQATEEEFLGHIEILIDAGIIRNTEIRRTSSGAFSACALTGVFITMQGHDLLDALRDASVWSRIIAKAKSVGVSISWEFIKAAIPAVMKDLCK